MTRILKLLAVLGAALTTALPAHATLLTRTFVSSTGVDTNPCTITQPCATFAQAYTLTAPSGIIAALDPGKYGALTIGMPVTVNGNGWAAITGPASGNGITIGNVPQGTIIVLKGIEIDGAGAAYNGIVVGGPAALTVSDCSIQNFVYNNSQSALTGNGILLAPPAGTLTVTIANTTVSDNANDGINYTSTSAPNANIIIDRVVANGNANGIVINENFASGGMAAVGISNTITSGNANNGIVIETTSSATINASIDNLNATANITGIDVGGTAKVLLGRSVITANGFGVNNGTSPNTFYTYKNNQINLNAFDGYSSLSTTYSPE